jgi:hypothetical protein
MITYGTQTLGFLSHRLSLSLSPIHSGGTPPQSDRPAPPPPHSNPNKARTGIGRPQANQFGCSQGTAMNLVPVSNDKAMMNTFHRPSPLQKKRERSLCPLQRGSRLPLGPLKLLYRLMSLHKKSKRYASFTIEEKSTCNDGRRWMLCDDHALYRRGEKEGKKKSIGQRRDRTAGGT